MNKSQLSFIKLERYEAPKAVEKRGEDWVEYGEGNDYYNVLLDLKDSPTNSALINGITDYIYGGGLKAVDASKDPEGWAAVKSMMSEDALRCLCDDYYTLGQGFLQCMWEGGKVKTVMHTPTQNWRPEKCNDEGEIEAYYYHDDWTKYRNGDEVLRVPAFGTTGKGTEVLCIKPYRAGYFYFTPVEYQSGLEYAQAEIDIANYHVNQIQHKFSSNTIINFNNGVPQPDEQREIETKIKNKFSGAEGDGITVAFNDSAESAASIETIQHQDVHQLYDFLATESASKLMVSHRVTSPILVGLQTSGGLGSNADELRTAAVLFDNLVIKPIQRQIIEGLNVILEANTMSFKLYFETLMPLDMTSVQPEQVKDENQEERERVEMASEYDASTVIETLGEVEEDLEGWVCIAEDDTFEDDGWDMEQEIKEINSQEQEARMSLLSKMYNLATTGVARPNAKSEWDLNEEELVVKVRYQYSPRSVSNDSREFCRRMTEANKLYRREDIEQMSTIDVHQTPAGKKGWGPRGAKTYDIFLYKGGGGCHHRWTRKIYARIGEDGNIDVRSPRAQQLVTSYRDVKAAGYDKGVDPDYQKAKTRPKDMPNRGFLK